MPGFEQFGKMLLILGGVMVFFGLLLTFMGKISGLGRLPGDIYFERGNFTFYFPLASSLLLSLILSLILTFLARR